MRYTPFDMDGEYQGGYRWSGSTFGARWDNGEFVNSFPHEDALQRGVWDDVDLHRVMEHNRFDRMELRMSNNDPLADSLAWSSQNWRPAGVS